MAYKSTLGSPGVEVIERDASLRVSTSGGTTIFIPGYASQGPVEEINSVSSIEDFENIYGTPTNMAETYFYYTVLAVLNNASSAANVLTCRLPYGKNDGDTVSTAFSMLIYPAIPVYRDKNTDHYYPYYELKDGLTISSIQHTSDVALVTQGSTDYTSILIQAQASDSSEPTVISADQITKDSNIKTTSLRLILDSQYQSGTLSVKSFNNTPTGANNTLNLIFTHTSDDTTTDITGTFNTDDVKISKNGSAYKYEIGGVVTDASNKNIGVIILEFTINSDEDIEIGNINASKLTVTVVSSEVAKCSVPFGKLDENGEITPFNNLDDLYFDNSFVKNGTAIKGENNNVTYLIGAPITYQVSYTDYYEIVTRRMV